jgi:hypothetical protein
MRNRTFFSIAVMAVAAVFILGMTLTADAGSKNVRGLVGNYVKSTQRLKTDRGFANKRVLLMVGSDKKSSTVDALLTSVDNALSDAQHSIFVIPLVVAENQNANYAQIKVSGTLIDEISLSGQQPAQERGLAALILQYEGDTTLARQVLANLEIK